MKTGKHTSPAPFRVLLLSAVLLALTACGSAPVPAYGDDARARQRDAQRQKAEARRAVEELDAGVAARSKDQD